MSHTVGEKAALAVKNSNRKSAVVETRHPDEIIKTLRGNLKSPLAILKTDVAVLLAAYDDAVVWMKKSAKIMIDQTAEITGLKEENKRLNEKLEEFRSVYEAENSRQSVMMERVPPTTVLAEHARQEFNADDAAVVTRLDYGTGPDGIGTPDMP
jgi:hypothetical protein